MKALLLIALMAVAACGVQSVKETHIGSQHFVIGFYNVENLFDTEADVNDEEFTPDSPKKWSEERYAKKISDLATVIRGLDSLQLPAIMGMAEIENRKVVADLVAAVPLAGGKYAIVHEDSPDFRGIDVALIYQPSVFEYIAHEKLPVTFDDEPNYTTRDILYVKGVLAGADTLHIFVNHWSSRREGEEASEPRRLRAASIVRTKVDVIQQANPKAMVVIMGDMNDEPQNNSLKTVLQAGNSKEAPSPSALYNLMYDKDLNNEGSYNYKGEWNMLDNLIVSYPMLDSNATISTTFDAGRLFAPDWIMFTNKQNEKSPSRTYGGNNYYGGYSDHLPAYFTVSVNKR